MNKSQFKFFNLLFFVPVILVLETPLKAQTARIDSINPKTGKVLLQREDWSDFQPVTEGTSINEGDQIYPSKGIKVRIICPDHTNKPVTPGVPSGMKNICPIWQARIAKASQPPGVLGGINNSIPYIISPRHSLLLSNTPTFRWNAVPGATEYIVELISSNRVIWQAEIQDTQIVYPGNSTLKPGISYSLKIQANTGKSSEQASASNLGFLGASYFRQLLFTDGKVSPETGLHKQSPNPKSKIQNPKWDALGFLILRPTEAEIVKAEAAKIEQEGFSPLVTGLLLAELYSNYILPISSLSAYNLTAETARSYNLTAEAIATLESLLQQGEKTPILYRTLGDLYWQSGLANLTTENYLKALERAKSPEFLEERTLAQFGLGEVAAATDNNQQAIFWYEQAKIGYVTLGNTQQAAFLERQIKALK